MQPKTYTPKKKVDEEGYDKEGVQHDKCGTPDCCGGCETSDKEKDKDGGIQFFRNNIRSFYQ